VRYGQQQQASHDVEGGQNIHPRPEASNAIMEGSKLRQFATFYFTNVPNLIPYFYLKKSFEVCGMLDNLFLSRKRNMYGQVYGFVRYANVKDVDKL